MGKARIKISYYYYYYYESRLCKVTHEPIRWAWKLLWYQIVCSCQPGKHVVCFKFLGRRIDFKKKLFLQTLNCSMNPIYNLIIGLISLLLFETLYVFDMSDTTFEIPQNQGFCSYWDFYQWKWCLIRILKTLVTLLSYVFAQLGCAFMCRIVMLLLILFYFGVYIHLDLFYLATKKAYAAYKQATRGPTALSPFRGTRQWG